MKKQEQLWFSHDCTTTSNPRMIALISVHGLLGYGRWWRLMEILRNEENYKYSITTKFAYNVLATAFMCTVEEAKDFINNCIEDYELLTTDGEFIWSESLLARMEHLENKRILLSERGKKGAAVTNAKRWRRASQEDNSSSQGDSLTVANVSQDVSNNNTVHNNTRQYKTQQLQQNKTIQNNTTTGNNTLVELEMMKQALLNDKSLFKYHLNNKDITKEKLAAWITTFTNAICIQGTIYESMEDFRNHFTSWFRFRDPVNEDPETYLFTNKTTASKWKGYK